TASKKISIGHLFNMAETLPVNLVTLVRTLHHTIANAPMPAMIFSPEKGRLRFRESLKASIRREQVNAPKMK
ncbi:MAG TPA: hypothetical protein VFW44_10385, partial [Bryobacteraceae bacterium]|nr:hypothetical protein [Bryobacteraceae bacterium]